MKLMIVGDWHGNIPWALKMIKRAQDNEVKAIIQCGDFGIWPGIGGMRYLDSLNDALRKTGINLFFVDGNHEDFDQLDCYDAHNPRTINGHVHLRTHILHIPRGTVWEWQGRTYAGVGGAVSIDKEWREPGKTWWPQEQLTDDQLNRIYTPKPVDFLFTHDCPTNAPFKNRLKPDLDSQLHRQKMDEVGKILKPKLWFHGHMHDKYDGYDFPTYEPTTKVYGLECDEMYWSYGILDTDAREFTWRNASDGI